MSDDQFRISDQIRHYRALAQIAMDCAEKSPSHRLPYIELAEQWTTLADRLESGAEMKPKTKPDAPSQARPRSSHSPH